MPFRCWPARASPGASASWSVGALNIQQREQDSSPSTNFTALRARRDILANSDIGVMFLNKDPNGSDHNRAFGADANFRFFGDLTANVALAKSDSPVAELPGEGDDWYSKSSIALSRQLLGSARHVPDDRQPLQRRDGLRAAHRRRQLGVLPRHAHPAAASSAAGCARRFRTSSSRTSPSATAAGSNRATWTGTGRSRSRTAPSSRSASTRTSR